MSKKTKQMLLLLGLLAAAVIALLVVKLGTHLSTKRAQEQAAANAITIDLPAEPTTLTLQYADNTLTLQKDSDGNWTWDAETEPDDSAVQALTFALSDLVIEDAFAPEDTLAAYGLAEPLETLTVSDGENSQTLLIGSIFDAGDETLCYAKTADSETIYVLDNALPSALDGLTAAADPNTES